MFGIAFGALALLLWGYLIPAMLTQAQTAASMLRAFNASPMSLIGTPLAILTGLPAATAGAPFSIAIGAYLAWRAFKRKDTALAVLAWAFFMPYLALYGLLLHLALFAARAPRAALVTSLAVWVIFGSMLGNHLFTNLMR
jgi:hypothetical protein